MFKRIGLLGGTFNPIHCGHMAMAEAARAALNLDAVVLMPAGDPPHKEPEGATAADRLRMTELAADGRFPVSSMEIDRPGKTYTVDTLEALTAQGAEEIHMLIGADTLRELKSWREPDRVFALCRFIAFGRVGCVYPDAPEGARVTKLEAEIPGVSSTQVRARVHAGLSIEGLVLSAVERYIGVNRLYDPPRLLSPDEMRAKLQASMKSSRFDHVEGVEQTMRRLARRYGVDEEKAALAGLLHDCAKGMSLEEMRAAAAKYEVAYDPMETNPAALLHAPVGAAVARAEYGVTDPDVLHAIRFHTTGCAEMSVLDQLLFLADMIEPTRRPYPGLEELRAAAEQDLFSAVLLAMRHQSAYIAACGHQPHPDEEAALLWAEKKEKIFI